MMKFGFQLGSGAVSQRDAFAASGKLNILRFSVIADGYGFDQAQTIGYLQYCQKYNVIPHATFFNNDLSTYPSDRITFVSSFFNIAYDMGIREMSTEVGNELDGSMTFPVYCSLYAECATGFEKFKETRPFNTAQYLLGGAASTTGAYFTAAVMLWAKYHGYAFDFASWHHGTYCNNDELKTQISHIKSLNPTIPIYLTEVGHQLINPTSEQTQDTVDWINGLFPLNVDVFIWMIACNDTDSGIWKADGTITSVGQVLLSKL